MGSHALEAAPTLMGMMMSCDDLPSAAAAVAPSTPPPRTARPASAWHSEVDTCATSAASTAVGDPAVAIQVAAPEDEVKTPKKDSSDSVANLKEDGFIAVARPLAPSPANSNLGLGWDRSEDDDSQSGSPPRSRKLGQIISISGLRRSFSQTDLALPRRPSRIRSAMTKVSRSWQQHFAPQGEERGGGVGGRPETGSLEPVRAQATGVAR